MIVSASRRTDLPGYYSEWLLRRLRDGFVVAVNPFNPGQRRHVPLGADDVDAFVFWTRDPRRLAALTAKIERLGHPRWIAHVTVTGLSSELEPRGVPAREAVQGIRRLAERAGDPRRVIWRYDPIVLGPRDRPEQHRERFDALAEALEGSVRQVVVSHLDLYRKTARRLQAAGYPHEGGVSGPAPGGRGVLLGELAALARRRGIELRVCAEPDDYTRYGAPAGRCVDPELLSSLFPDREFPRRKDPGQRAACGCAPSVDIGMPDTCLRGCVYCYATRSDRTATDRARRHDPAAPTLVPVAPPDPEREIHPRTKPEGRGESRSERPRLPGL